MIINGRFAGASEAVSAVLALKRAGVAAGRIDVYSAKPLEFESGVLDRPSRMSLGAVVGAVLAGSGITAFMFYAQLDYPLITGGMPLTSAWATGVITFEATMGGAILATALMFLKESGLGFPRRAEGAAPTLRGDEVVVRLVYDDDEADVLLASLRSAGAISVEVIEESA